MSALRAFSLCLFAVLLVFCFGCRPEASNRLVVGMELNYPPFEMVDSAGHPAGISVDMTHALSKFLQKEAQIQNVPFDGLIPALKTGKIDLIISSMTATPERAQSIDFSEPYLRTGLCLLVNKNVSLHSIEEADRPDVRIAVKQGTTGQIYAQGHLTHAHLLVLDKEDACVLEVVQGKAQAFVYDQISVFKHWQQHQDSTKALLQPIRQEAWAIGVRKGNDKLREQLNAFLSDFRAHGGFEELGDRYLTDQKNAFRKMGIPFYF